MLAGVAGPVAVLEAELSRARVELAQLKGGVDPDATCGKGETAMSHRIGARRHSSHAKFGSSRVEYVVG